MGLDWEEGVFRGLVRLTRLVRRATPPADPQTVALSVLQHRLAVVAQVIAGRPLRLRPAERWGGIHGDTLRLPATLACAGDSEANTALYLARVVSDAAIIRLELDRHAGPAPVLSALHAAHQAAQWLAVECPGFAALHAAARDREQQRYRGNRCGPADSAIRSALAGGEPWLDATLIRQLHGIAADLDTPLWGALLPQEYLAATDTNAGAEAARRAQQAPSESAAPVKDQVRQVVLDAPTSEMVPQAPYERTETADAYRGGARDTDSEDDLDDHLEALRDCDLREVMRGGDPAASLYRMELRVDGAGGEVADSEAVGIRYDEWDHRRKAYRKDWCTVQTGQAAAGSDLWARAALAKNRRQIDRLQRLIERHRQGLQAAGRQLDGEDIDMPAVIDEIAARHAGHGGDQRLYSRLERQRRDIAVTVLIDISLSTDAYVQGLRVLDVAREAVLILGETCARLGDRLRILAFSTNTRTRCRVWEVQGWREPWRLGRARLGALEPCGYTRIGAALRHATAGLCAEPAERRLLLLISDGKATDFDRYEGRHGDADVRQALIEAQRRGVHCQALAIDACAREHLPAMFGAGRWHLMPRPSDLPEALAKVYARLTAA